MSGPAESSEAPRPRPEVIVEFLFERGVLFVAMRNIGARPALRVAVRFTPPLRGLGGSKDIGAQAMFRQVEFLGPNREIATVLDSSSAWFASEQPTKIAVEVAYRDAEGQAFTDTIRHDLEIYRDLVFIDAGSAEPSGDRVASTKE